MAYKSKPKTTAKMVIDRITPDESVELTQEVDSPYPVLSDTIESAPTVTLKEDLVLEIPVEKNVKVRLAEKHSCTIGGERYFFEKGKVYTVPVNVKSILSRVGLLTAL